MQGRVGVVAPYRAIAHMRIRLLGQIRPTRRLKPSTIADEEYSQGLDDDQHTASIG